MEHKSRQVVSESSVQSVDGACDEGLFAWASRQQFARLIESESEILLYSTLLCSTTAAAVVVAAGTVAIVAQSSHQCDRL